MRRVLCDLGRKTLVIILEKKMESVHGLINYKLLTGIFFIRDLFFPPTLGSRLIGSAAETMMETVSEYDEFSTFKTLHIASQL